MKEIVHQASDAKSGISTEIVVNTDEHGLTVEFEGDRLLIVDVSDGMVRVYSGVSDDTKLVDLFAVK